MAVDRQRRRPQKAIESIQEGQVNQMNLRMSIDGVVIATATLDVSRSAEDFVTLLPLTLRLKDYEATEKIADLPRQLTTAGVPDSYTSSAGDICFYAPWGNLAFFYKAGAPSQGLVRLGRFASGLDQLVRDSTGNVAVKVELSRP
jgi:hypothetical protein